MDVESLRAEMEEHLKNNPDKDAPGGFRDRFAYVAEQHASDDCDFPKPVLEAQLMQIRVEAEAAVKAARADSAPKPRMEAPAEPTREIPRPHGDPGDPLARPSSALKRSVFPAVIVLIVLAASLFYVR